MSWIGNNLINTPFSGFPGAASGQELGAGPAAGPLRAQPDAMVTSFPGSGVLSSADLGGGDTGGLSGLMSGFSAYISNLFNQISAWYNSGQSGTNSSAAAGGSSSNGTTAQYGSPLQYGSPPEYGAPFQYGSPAQYGSGQYGNGGRYGSPGPYGNGGQYGLTRANPNEQYFSKATASSWGDPHDTFDGTNAAGKSVNESWDNMHGHADLLDSSSFAGGFRVSTQTTQPNAQGVTMNQCASVTTNSGNTVVSLDANGQAQITSYGNPITLQAGQTAQLGNGESVTQNADGSLTVNDTNATGGEVSTTLKTNGNGGVDVNAQASGVRLGGYLVSQNDDQPPERVSPGYPYPQRPSPWRPHPDGANATGGASPFDEVEQLSN
jgi:hypothetical protein